MKNKKYNMQYLRSKISRLESEVRTLKKAVKGQKKLENRKALFSRRG